MSKISRRQFLTASAASCVAMSASGEAAMSDKPQLIHTVYFWLKNPDSQADRDQLVNGLRSLKGIPGINKMHIGLPANTEKRDVVDNSFQVFELMYFDDLAAQSAYQAHPTHLAFVESCSHLWEKVVVHDAITV